MLLAIVEYAIVLGLVRKQKDKKNQKANKVQSLDSIEDNETFQVEKIIIQMDKWTMIASAVFIVIFNIGYWTYYILHKLDYIEEPQYE